MEKKMLRTHTCGELTKNNIGEDTQLSGWVHSWRNHGGVVFIDSAEPPTSKAMIDENMEAVQKVSGIKVAGVINWIDDFSKPGRECYQALERMF